VLTCDNLYRGVAQAIYGDQVALENKPTILRRIQEDGFWLIDACDGPVNKLKSGMRDAAIKKSVTSLVQKCLELSPKKGVIICHGRVYKFAADSLREAGINILHSQPIPFPSNNGNKKPQFKTHKDEFLAVVRDILKDLHCSPS
jgi:hypothetical protein